MDYSKESSLKNIVVLTPEERAADNAQNLTDFNRQMLLQEIGTAKNPQIKSILEGEYKRIYGDGSKIETPDEEKTLVKTLENFWGEFKNANQAEADEIISGESGFKNSVINFLPSVMFALLGIALIVVALVTTETGKNIVKSVTTKGALK